jgi:hypothetical protein
VGVRRRCAVGLLPPVRRPAPAGGRGNGVLHRHAREPPRPARRRRRCGGSHDRRVPRLRRGGRPGRDGGAQLPVPSRSGCLWSPACPTCDCGGPSANGRTLRDTQRHGRVPRYSCYFRVVRFRAGERPPAVVFRGARLRLPATVCCTSSRSFATRRLTLRRFLRVSLSLVSTSLRSSREPRLISDLRSFSAAWAASIESFKPSSDLWPGPPAAAFLGAVVPPRFRPGACLCHCHLLADLLQLVSLRVLCIGAIRSG